MSKKHCCSNMTDRVNYICRKHADPFDCPDTLIFYSSKFDEYGLIVHDGGSSCIDISFCPWCGTKLPLSKRELWFDTLERLGYEDPFEQDITEDFNSNKWYNK
ncbi:DUF6980 family protein [Peribacillus sp. B-H-3]|uniref:DUF6980 family protein n=1 Tax=Peribacillus sp. B-H-3 TaxID=3400420 RepID=UPI003B01ADE9